MSLPSLCPHSPRPRAGWVATLFCAVAIMMGSPTQAQAQTQAQATADASADFLVGTWKIDLRPTPGAAPYFAELVITSVGANRFTGTFYGAPIGQARLNVDWGAVRLAFVTQDGSGAYHHAAVLQGTRLQGMTNSTGRDFLSVWSAERR